jgi:hypothetical protein
MILRRELLAIVEDLVRKGAPQLSLDAISEAIGATAITLDELDLLFTALEQRGLQVGDDSRPAASAHLGQVLQTARRLREEHGRTPSPADIAEASGLDLAEVRLALLAVKILQR